MDREPSNIEPIKLPESNLFKLGKIAQELSINQRFKEWSELFDQTYEKMVHGRVLTPEERQYKKQLAIKQRNESEIDTYGRVLTPSERNDKVREERLERSKEQLFRTKLNALETEKRLIQSKIRQLQTFKSPAIELSNHRNPFSIIKESTGEYRTLQALKTVFPEGLTVSGLADKTRKDLLSDNTPENSLRPWLKKLKKLGLAEHDKNRPKKWFYKSPDS